MNTSSTPSPTTPCHVRGGARIGFVNYTWPLATLECDAAHLSVATTMFGLLETGRHRFSPEQVVAIEPYGGIPVLGDGIRIRHTSTEAPEKIIFWCNPASTLKAIANAGFIPAGKASELSSVGKSRGFPLRIVPILVAVAIWNALFIFQFLQADAITAFPGPLMLAAVAFLFGISAAALRFPGFQAQLLKPGRSFEEVRPVFLLLTVISGLMLLVFTLLTAAKIFR
ncbi:hypothetical protein [Verrucomicrobium sp. BvORR106]|uniref:hypothetical protein n=1 Tax=Verrucomicrobium sp. BvORR106 TaxID=1403819 RepID=UPI00068B4CAA|nr:hypothetical protein [Verrucomicrobium sp. BvORR106]